MIDLAAMLLSMMLRATEAQRPRLAETVTVVGADPTLATPAAVTALGRAELAAAPAATLDDTLRSVPGFSLFRRSSSRVANPTTQGATLRGLAASGSSRALVLADGVPLNDPVGGWVYWNRVPVAALDEVTVARGAAGDLHGADAIGGVITLRSAGGSGVRALAEAGSHGTVRASAFGGWSEGDTAFLAAVEGFTTDGFVTIAPESRGPIDVEARSRHGSAHAGLVLDAGDSLATLRGSHFGESRGNGTPVQRNSTRITQASGRLDRGTLFSARGYAQMQGYEQTFSAIADDRASERQTSEQDVTAAAIGGAVDWTWSGAGGSAALSGTARLVDAELEQYSFAFDGTRQPPRLTTPHQAIGAIAAQGAVHRARAGIGGGLRAEVWRSSFETTSHRVFVSPRLWAVFAPTGELSLRLSVQSGYRAPTINELYRPFRVGGIVTNANPDLDPEAARGLEGGALWHRHGITLRALGFWSRVDDAITNVTVSVGEDLIVRQRQNAARIRVAGAEIELEARLTPSLTLTATSSLVDSIFTRGPLAGLRVPQVPRVHHALGVRGAAGPWRLSAEWRYIGRQFDDDRNAFSLSPSSTVDARAGWTLRRGVELFAAVENATDAEQDVGRTPLRTVGLPRTSRAGVRIFF
jgi:outer membrane receptor protein involved in Fe transport